MLDYELPKDYTFAVCTNVMCYDSKGCFKGPGMVIDNSKQHYTIGMANGDVRNYPHGSGNIRMTTRAELDKLQAVEHVDYREPVVGTFADHEQPTSTPAGRKRRRDEECRQHNSGMGHKHGRIGEPVGPAKTPHSSPANEQQTLRPAALPLPRFLFPLLRDAA